MKMVHNKCASKGKPKTFYCSLIQHISTTLFTETMKNMFLYNEIQFQILSIKLTKTISVYFVVSINSSSSKQLLQNVVKIPYFPYLTSAYQSKANIFIEMEKTHY